ncbi:(2Fe-2S)-binding protein [Pseudonocardia sp.]|uniref:(2Fe-2S)-binding protein n=1 Tax=Pseudonocardia sp. TaxID=60912 RepID=UPI003D132234
MSHPLDLTVNGVRAQLQVAVHRSLLSVLREDVGLTGPKEGCDDSECGACMVLLDGEPVNSCSYLAVQADDREVVTVEGVGSGGDLHPVQRELLAAGGVQCGFCTPGVVVSAAALLEGTPDPDEEQVRRALAGNLCRCTGYQKIVEAVLRAAASSR